MWTRMRTGFAADMGMLFVLLFLMGCELSTDEDIQGDDAIEESDEESDSHSDRDEDIDRGEDEPMSQETESDEPDETVTEETSGQWTCPTDWDTFECVANHGECLSKNGRVADVYGCFDSDGSVCCDTTPIPLGDEPCPVDEPGVSCQFSWECWKADGELLFNDYYCAGDNQMCCLSHELDEQEIEDGGAS